MAHAWKQDVSTGNSVYMGHIRRQFGIHEVETIGGERSCLAHKTEIRSEIYQYLI